MHYSRMHLQQPQRRKRKKSRKHVGLIVFLIVATGIGLKGYDTLKPGTQTAPHVQGETVSKPPSKYNLSTVPLPVIGQAAIAVSEESLNIHSSSDELWPMASVTKVITALAILEKAPIEAGQQGDTFVLNQKDEQYYWDYAAKLGTLTPVTAGYEMTAYEMLQTMLLASSNNMTDSLVDRYFANHEEFVDYTNEMLKNYGLSHTKVADAAGFSPDSASTPTEMIKIGQIALKNPIISEIVRQPNASPRVAGWIPNYNALITQPGVTGIKPGLTDQSGHNLLFSFETPNASGETVTVIGIVMGIFERSEYQRTLNSLLDSAKAAVITQ